MRYAFLILAFLVGFPPPAITGQVTTVDRWKLSGGLSASWFPQESEWSFSHPYYGAGNPTWETLRGRFSYGIRLQGSLEARRRRLGVQGAVGILPQRFIMEGVSREKEMVLLTGGLSGVLYLPAGAVGGSLEPFLFLGAGGQKATGDLDNTGFYLSAGGGFQAKLTPRLSLNGGVEYSRYKYTQVDLAESNIQKDLLAKAVSFFLGTRFSW